MLKVKTYLAVSAVHGIGLFADQDIPGGAAIWEFNPMVDLEFSCEEWQQLRKSISPDPRSFSAPLASMMVRESVLEET